MAMISCPECRNNISNQALSCPYCGHPINKHNNSSNNHNTQRIIHQNTAPNFHTGFGRAMDELGETVGRFVKKVLLIIGIIVLIFNIIGFIASSASHKEKVTPEFQLTPK